MPLSVAYCRALDLPARPFTVVLITPTLLKPKLYRGLRQWVVLLYITCNINTAFIPRSVAVVVPLYRGLINTNNIKTAVIPRSGAGGDSVAQGGTVTASSQQDSGLDAGEATTAGGGGGVGSMDWSEVGTDCKKRVFVCTNRRVDLFFLAAAAAYAI